MRLLVHSHHKCATRWMMDYLSRLALLNGRSFDSTDATAAMGSLTAEVSFFGNAAYPEAAMIEGRAFHIVRNPLSVIVSAYYSHLRSHPDVGWELLLRQRELLQTVDRETGFYLTLAFLERSDFAPGCVGPIHALRSWNYDDPRFTLIRMEDLVRGPAEVGRTLMPLPTDRLPPDEEFSFERYSGGRAAGLVDSTSHYRSGIADDWRSELPAGIVAYVRTHLGALLRHAYPDVL